MKHICTCTCGKVIISSRKQSKCRECYLSTPFPRLKITLDDVAAYGNDGVTAKDAAACLSVSYIQLRRVIKKNGLQHLFPTQGGAARWKATNGYAK